MIAGAINTNVDALYALNSLNNTTNQADSLEQQLSSGLAINSPADNPAGYIAAQGFTTQLGGVTQAISNVNQAVSLVQTADGAVQQQINILQSLNTIANQAANAINTPSQLASLQQVVSQLQTQVSTISQQAQFNNQNLLDGSFQGVQFQVGPNDGQTIQLSIGNTAASQLGAYQSQAATGATDVYPVNGSASGGVDDSSGNSYAISSAGAFTAGTFGVSGSAGGASVTVAATDSAKDVATAVNAVTAKTNVSAVADTSVAFTVTSGSFSFTLGNGTATAPTNTANISATVTGTVNADSLAGLVNAINQQTGQTGVTASISGDELVLTQSQGDNISISGFTGTGTLAAGGTTTTTIGVGGSDVAKAMVQGVVTMQSDNSFALAAGGSDIGLQTSSTFASLSQVNVSTVSGANSALNVIGFAMQQLENVGGQLGAIQQRLNASVSNLQTTQVNMTSALSTIQDANIPQVTTQLTQEQILQQAGVDALAQSSTLQQSFLRLLQ